MFGRKLRLIPLSVQKKAGVVDYEFNVSSETTPKEGNEMATLREVLSAMLSGKAPVDTSTEYMACPRCGGDGYLPQFRHVNAGQCFRCKGTGGVPAASNVVNRTRGPRIPRHLYRRGYKYYVGVRGESKRLGTYAEISAVFAVPEIHLATIEEMEAWAISAQELVDGGSETIAQERVDDITARVDNHNKRAAARSNAGADAITASQLAVIHQVLAADDALLERLLAGIKSAAPEAAPPAADATIEDGDAVFLV